MSQNVIPLDLSALDDALAMIESHLAGLQPAPRRDLDNMGGKSEAFRRQALSVPARTPPTVPASVAQAAAQADRVALETLRPRMQRLQQLLQRAQDTEITLGGDIIGVALEVYRLLKAAGHHRGLDGLRRELSVRSAKAPRAPKAETVVMRAME